MEFSSSWSAAFGATGSVVDVIIAAPVAKEEAGTTEPFQGGASCSVAQVDPCGCFFETRTNWAAAGRPPWVT
jgi:hypothetical protein